MPSPVWRAHAKALKRFPTGMVCTLFTSCSKVTCPSAQTRKAVCTNGLVFSVACVLPPTKRSLSLLTRGEQKAYSVHEKHTCRYVKST